VKRRATRSGAALIALLLTQALAAAPLRLPLADLAPWNYLDADCHPAGIAVDLLNEIGRRSGVDVHWVDMPYAQIQPALLAGELDADLNERNAWFEEHLQPLAPLFSLDDVVIVRHDRADAAGRLSVGHLSTHNSRAIVLRGMDVDVVEFDAYATLAQAFQQGRLDAVAGLKEPLLFHLYRHGASAELVRTLRTLQSVPVWLYVRPGLDAAQAGRLRQAILDSNLKDLLLKSRSLHLGLHRVRALPDAGHCRTAAEPSD
jgi:ABC-type amino acid transport substrate-binding protein